MEVFARYDVELRISEASKHQKDFYGSCYRSMTAVVVGRFLDPLLLFR